MAMENVTVSKPPAQTAERIAERLSPPPGEDLPPASDPVISVSGLRMSYGAVEAVSGIDLAVYPGGGGSVYLARDPASSKAAASSRSAGG